ncbi:flagellar export apparatus protein FliQ [Thiohalobacter sp. COW1]|uniref:Flagellar biosynthetic protein FliQ n=1 Tax=Thiohalobacter thiocyanaticus TaxID=585455 RepID=A0A1Z4VQH3_9GAMM|nr:MULTISPECIES: flagellar biosynthesis protein FliQ [Thiohalobacter]BAZ93886.1 flagellar biosynthesis pathway, component FliQ [Thiohalobacter thiocyanaticus]BCO31046.1 flagellar export apparatus protein FliQ [Thiohalobacter sp. COW1]
MTPDTVITIGEQAMYITVLLAGPLLIASLAVGLVIAMFQAATQINEMTLTFIPKLAAIVLVLLLAGPWLLRSLLDFTINLYTSIPGLIG